MIDTNTVERIIEASNVVDVIQDFVTLKRRGANYLGLCPFHNEKTPSFMVSPSKNIFKCFGCGKGGTPVTFIMEHEHFSYYESLKYLAKKYNIDVIEREETEEDIKQKNLRESLEIVTGFAAKYFSNILNSHKEGIAIGQSYFKERGFVNKTIEKFELGYCLDTKDTFTKEALKNGYNVEYLVKMGLTTRSNENLYDKFHGRVIFPIHSLTGKVIAFGARTLRKDKETAKYFNSSESEIYYKSKILYGIFHAKRAITEKSKCYLVEGYTDVISMHQAGIENVVASSGTSLTVEQIRLIKRFTNNITIIYDGDKAGINAALRGIDLVIEEGLDVKVLLLPEGEDPDSFTKSVSSQELNKYITENETDFIKFKTRVLLNEAGNDPSKKASIISNIISSISLIPNNLARSLYVKECSTLLDVQESILHYELTNILQKKRVSNSGSKDLINKTIIAAKQNAIVNIKNFDVVENEIIRLLLTYGNKELYFSEDLKKTVASYIIEEIINDEIELSNPLYAEIFKTIVEQYNEDNVIDNKLFINHQNQEICKLTIDMLTPKYDLSKIWDKHDSLVSTEDMILRELVPKTIISYKYAKIKKELTEIEKNLKVLKDDEKSKEIIGRQMLLKKIQMKISKLIGNRTI